MRSVRGSLAFVGALALVTIVRFAQAHAVGLSSGEYTVTGAGVAARLVLAQADAEGLDADALWRDITVNADGKPCALAIDEIGVAPPAGIAYRARFICDPPRQRLEVRAAFFERLPEGHRHTIRVRLGARSVEDILYRRHDTVVLAVDSGLSRPQASASTSGLFRMGLEHILTGYDHLVFLLGLVLVGGSLRSLLAIVTAFTIAHSLTLGAATVGIWAPPARIIEPAIALSIAYVGIENFFVSDTRGRWRVTFPFGLVHGFGFAGALRSAAISRSDVPAALLSFNFGVEVGQIAVLAVMLPALLWLRRSKRYASMSRALSAAVFATGAVWFVARIGLAPT